MFGITFLQSCTAVTNIFVTILQILSVRATLNSTLVLTRTWAAKALIRLSLAQSGRSFHFSPFNLKLM